MLLLAGTALISYYMVASSSDRLVTKFVMELSQNLYFVGVVLTYVLWGAMMKLRENRTRLMQLVLSMGVYFSAFAGSYRSWQSVSRSDHLALRFPSDGHVAADFLGLYIHEGS